MLKMQRASAVHSRPRQTSVWWWKVRSDGSIGITWGGFKPHSGPDPSSTSKDSALIGLGWGLGVGRLQSSPGDSNVQPRLRTPSVNEKNMTFEVHQD